MKKIILFIAAFLILCAQVINAQAPNSFDFQSLVRDASGKFLKSQSVGVRVSILHGSVSGTAVYTETHTVSTNANGLLTLTVGKGTTSDNFSSINWSAGPYFIKTEMDLSGGTDYTLSTVTQMMSVPYALYANSAGNYEARLAALDARADAMESTVATAPTYHADGFSIAPHRQVKFSKGNLCYNYSTSKYAFAAQQYTFSLSRTAISGSSGTSYLFNIRYLNGRGTGTYDEYSPNCEGTRYDIAYYARTDIGLGWFTPSIEHWDYLILFRPNANKLYSRATVNGVAGLIILPDGWSLPSGLTFKPAQSSWTTNTYSTTQWTTMENAGAVFLPTDPSSSYAADRGSYRCSSGLYKGGAANDMCTRNIALFNFVSSSNCGFTSKGRAMSTTANYSQVRLVKDY